MLWNTGRKSKLNAHSQFIFQIVEFSTFLNIVSILYRQPNIINLYNYLTKTHNWVERVDDSTAAIVSLSQSKVNDFNLNDRLQMQNDTGNEIGSSLFPFSYGLRVVIL